MRAVGEDVTLDINAKFLKRLQRVITQIQDDHANVKNESEEITDVFVNFYKDLLGHGEGPISRAVRSILQHGQILTEEHQIKLLQPYTSIEVKKVMFIIDINKNPGPDSYGSEFFKAAWEIISSDITEAILEFFSNGQLLQQVNATMIALIPKVETPLNASQYRPISCFNMVYKCTTKIICNRLKEIIPNIVAENQTAFMQGRTMMQNMLICHDILRHYNRKTLPSCMMKIDLRKAYDMGHLSSVRRVLEALNHFSSATGLIANLDKSSIFVAGVDLATRNLLKEYTWFSLGEFPTRYLGLPLSYKK
uniref:Reverse transcriptase domain-containing protein n=1 Tax=Nicotiana tabacum TaxID=4097 RepID=A0A1S3XRG2_TOBAC|nr:PREDICTED: uncharacterized protein LOC107767705 [Nicotiana tabacum]